MYQWISQWILTQAPVTKIACVFPSNLKNTNFSSIFNLVGYVGSQFTLTSDERYSVSNNRQCDCSLERLYRMTRNKTSMLHINGPLWGRGIHRWLVVSLTQGQKCRNPLHVMTSSRTRGQIRKHHTSGAFWVPFTNNKPRSHSVDLEVPISTTWKIVENGMVGSWSRGNIVLTFWKSARSGNDRQQSESLYDKVLL